MKKYMIALMALLSFGGSAAMARQSDAGETADQIKHDQQKEALRLLIQSGAISRNDAGKMKLDKTLLLELKAEGVIVPSLMEASSQCIDPQ